MAKKELLVVRTQIKENASFNGVQMNVSRDFAEKLNSKVDALIKDACERAQSNGRTTVMARDL